MHLLLKKQSTKGGITQNVIFGSFFVISILTSLFISSQESSSTAARSGLIGRSVIFSDIENRATEFALGDIRSNQQTGSYSTGSLSLETDSAVTVMIPSKSYSGSRLLKTDFSPDAGNSVLRVDLKRMENGKAVPANRVYSTKNGVTLSDTSAWSKGNRDDAVAEQIKLSNQGLYAGSGSVSRFASDELLRVGSAGTYATFDLGEYRKINSISLQLQNLTGSGRMNMISLTFDSGTRYNYFIQDKTSSQKFIFPETKTRYVRIDVISDTSVISRLSSEDALTGISRNITASDVMVSMQDGGGSFSIDLSRLISIDGASFARISFSSTDSIEGISGLKSYTQSLNSPTEYRYTSIEPVKYMIVVPCDSSGKCSEAGTGNVFPIFATSCSWWLSERTNLSGTSGRTLRVRTGSGFIDKTCNFN